jgi:hypothetical protein
MSDEHEELRRQLDALQEQLNQLWADMAQYAQPEDIPSHLKQKETHLKAAIATLQSQPGTVSQAEPGVPSLDVYALRAQLASLVEEFKQLRHQMEEGGDGGDVINAAHAQGLVNRPSGPVSINFQNFYGPRPTPPPQPADAMVPEDVQPCDYLGFLTNNAVEEQEFLHHIFVPPPLFKAFKGNPAHRQSIFVFGGRGMGKTAVCSMLEQALQDEKRTLTVHLNLWPEQDIHDALNLDVWLEYIAFGLVTRLHRELEQSSERRNKLRDSDTVALYTGLCQRYAITPHPETTAPPDAVAEALAVYDQQSVLNRFDRLQRMVQGAGFTSVCVLIDRLAGANPNWTREQIVQLLRPLLENLRDLTVHNFAFKLFLPDTLEEPIRQFDWLSEIRTYPLKWDDILLHRMIAMRMRYIQGAVSPIHASDLARRFADLCVSSEVGIDEELVAAAQGSPRRLMDLMNTIIETHCQGASAGTRIDRESIDLGKQIVGT